MTLVGVVALGVGLRLWLAFHDDGIYWPDEVFQSLEPAHRLVFGYGLIAWEFVEGARNWALPGLVAGLLGLARAFGGGEEPRLYLGVVRVAFCLIAGGTVWGTYRLARAAGATAWSAVGGAALIALSAPVIYFGHRAMSETAAALPAVLGLALVLERRGSVRGTADGSGHGAATGTERGDVTSAEAPPRWRLWLGASLLGLAVLFRLQCGVLCVGALGVLAGRRRWREAAELLGVLLVWALLYGLLDRLTWGGWFHSAIKYLQFNLVEGKAALWGTADAGYYPRVLWRAMPLPALALALLVPFSARRAPGLLLTAVAFLALHVAVPHKELRFILPALPLLAALAAVGADALGTLARGRLPPWLLAGACLAAGLVSAASLRALTFGDLGQYEDSRPGASALDDVGPVNRLLLAAHAQPDLCGLKVEAIHLAWSGGASYLHRPVPLYPHFGPPRESGLYNYVLTLPGWARPGTIVAADGPLVLLRLPNADCRPDPHYDWRLP